MDRLERNFFANFELFNSRLVQRVCENSARSKDCEKFLDHFIATARLHAGAESDAGAVAAQGGLFSDSLLVGTLAR